MAGDDVQLLVRVARLARLTGARRGRRLRAAVLAALCGTLTAGFAQEEDLTLPPRLDDSPGSARLAAPARPRDERLEEVIVVSESEWRLPDLGSTWRANEAAEPATGRIDAAFLPLYDPERETANFDPFGINRELSRVGFVELFRVQFGGRSPAPP